MIPVNEIFQSVQGEGHWTGTPAVFVRLQGCAVGCPWCDTKHTWSVDGANEVSRQAIIAKTKDAPTFARLSEDDIVEAVCAHSAKHVVITGGEPCEYDLRGLCDRLNEAGRAAQIETSGTREIRAGNSAWVTLSPKFDMPGGLKVRADAVARANEIKMPVGKAADIEKLRAFLDATSATGHVWLQPISQSARATALCIEAAARHRWRVSLQMHKFLGVR